MKVNILEMLLGQVPEAIYFALFMIFTKRLKEKRVLFTILMVIEITEVIEIITEIIIETITGKIIEITGMIIEKITEQEIMIVEAEK